MKKYIGYIITVMVSVILTSTITIMAYSYNSSDMVYTPSNSNWKVSNVSDAITDLHNMKTSDIYSSEEKVVGKWIDGKPVYQKTYTGTILEGRNKLFDKPTNMKKVLSVTGYTYHSTGNQLELNNGEYGIFLYNDNYFCGYGTAQSSYIGGEYIATIKYTKTTDYD